MERVSSPFAHSTFSIETGRMAKQADGAVLVQFGETVVLAAVVGAKEPMPGKDFFPLTDRVPREVLFRGTHPGRLVQARGETPHEGNPDFPFDRPAHPALLSRRLLQ